MLSFEWQTIRCTSRYPFFSFHHRLYTDWHIKGTRGIMWMSANKFLLVIFFNGVMLFDFCLHKNDSLQTSVNTLNLFTEVESCLIFRFLNSQLDAERKKSTYVRQTTFSNSIYSNNFSGTNKQIAKRHVNVTVIILFMKVNDAICVVNLEGKSSLH